MSYIPIFDKNNKYVVKVLNILTSMFPNDEMDVFHYIMYYLATCLDNKPDENIILILTGMCSGKSTFLELVNAVFDNYAIKMNISFLNKEKNNYFNYDMSQLKSARLAYYSESDYQETLNTIKLKLLANKEYISHKLIYEKSQMLKPICFHILTTNYPPIIQSNDENIWKNIITYEFKIKFVNNPNFNNKFEKLRIPELYKELTTDNMKTAFLSILSEYLNDLRANHNNDLNNILKPTIDKETLIYKNKQIYDINKFNPLNL